MLRHSRDNVASTKRAGHSTLTRNSYENYSLAFLSQFWMNGFQSFGVLKDNFKELRVNIALFEKMISLDMFCERDFWSDGKRR